MNLINLSFLFVVIFASTTFSFSAQSKGSTTFSYSTELFAKDFFMKLDEGNQFASPILVQSALSLLPERGRVLNELKNVLRFRMAPLVWYSNFRHYLQFVQHSEIELHVANTMYVKNTINLKPTYINQIEFLGAEVKRVNFSQPIVVAEDVNNWVANNTNNKITKVLDPSNVDPNTETLLLSALYFQGSWESPFSDMTTMPREFYVDEFNTISTDMMRQTSEFNYAENDQLDAKFLEMPYKNSTLKMTIVLPNKRNGLSRLESQIKMVFLKQNMSLRKVSLILPKFKIESSVDCREILKSLGLKSIFNEGLSIGRGTRKLPVNKVIQKTYLEVNENGSEAAAVVEMEIGNKFGDTGMENFAADHPFLFFISDDKTNAVLFIGRFVKPNTYL